MSEDGKTLTYTQSVNAPISQVYRAFSTAPGLQEWFGDVVEADSRESGRVYLWWNEGYYTSGVFKHLEEKHKVAFSWRGPGEPETRVRVLLEEADGATKVTLYHDFVPEGAEEGFNKEWLSALENLKSVLETGVDKRFFDRPMLGFWVGGMVDEKLQKRLGIAVDYGVHVAGVLEGMGAEKSGLQNEDVISTIEGVEIRSFRDISQAISGRKGGEVISTVIHRGEETLNIEVELSKRPVPEYPPAPSALAKVGKKAYRDGLKGVKAILEGATEKEASHQPSEGEWSAKEILAHLMVGERWSHHGWAIHPDGGKLPPYPGSSRYTAAIAKTYSTKALLKELKRSIKLHLEMIKTLPEEYVANKGSYFLTTQNFEQGIRNHFEQHTAQIKAAIASARESAAEPVPA